jgi:sphingolipid delta-4 desaturase
MGFTAEEYEAFYRKEFLWKTDKNLWHVQRAREIRKKYDVQKLEGYDPLTFFMFLFMSGSHLAMSILVSYYFSDNIFAVVMLGWALGGFWVCSAGLAIHEASHGLALPGKWGTYISGMVAEFPHFLPSFLTFKHYHMPHHAYISIDLGEKNTPQMSDKRKPKYDPDLPSEFEAYLFSKNWMTRVLFLFVQVFLYSFRPLVQFPRKLDQFDYFAFFLQFCYQLIAYHWGGAAAVIYLFSSSALG